MLSSRVQSRDSSGECTEGRLEYRRQRSIVTHRPSCLARSIATQCERYRCQLTADYESDGAEQLENDTECFRRISIQLSSSAERSESFNAPACQSS